MSDQIVTEGHSKPVPSTQVEKEPNYYELLNVESTASRLQIREAYLRMKSTFSPGSAALYSLVGEEEARASMEQVEEAFRVLNDELARRQYDDRVGLSATEVVPEIREQEKAAERLTYVREMNESIPSPHMPLDTGNVDYGSDSGFVRTMRSTLPIIKTKVSSQDNQERIVKYEELIEECDPADGDLYRQLRELANVSVDEMQARTKVSIGYLEALEANQFDRLPQLIYVKGFLRSYFNYLDVPDAERLVGAYSARFSDWQDSRKN